MKIIPAILTNDPEDFENLVARLSHKYSRIQIDFVDGEYASNKSIRAGELGSISKYPEIKFDAHLMVTQTNLEAYLSKLSGFDRIIVQMESISRPEDFDCLALDIHSPIEAIKPYLPNLKLVNLMSIEPGTGGQELIDLIFSKVSILRPLGNFKIAVDGGIEQKHLEKLESLGVDEVVVGAARMLSWR